MSDVELELVARMSTELEKANFPSIPPIPAEPITKLEAMEELTVKLNNARKMREFAYGRWGDQSSYKLWEKDTRLYNYLLDNLKECDGETQSVPERTQAETASGVGAQTNPTAQGQAEG